MFVSRIWPALEETQRLKILGKQPAYGYDYRHSGTEEDGSAKGTDLSWRVAMMFVIFFVSLFAASFPAISKRVRSLRIPRILFFIGKHFGTGVILSTAFVHLLQDAFERLMDPAVKKQTKVGHWTGLIVLGSLLTIFLVEYVSTSYVDRLQSYPSAPPSPKLEPSTPLPPSPDHLPHNLPSDSPATSNATLNEQTPLLSTFSNVDTNSNARSNPSLNPPSRRFSAPSVQQGAHSYHHSRTNNSTTSTIAHTHTHTHGLGILEGHHRHESRGSHGCHHATSRKNSNVVEVFDEDREGDGDDDGDSGPVVPNGHHRGQSGGPCSQSQKYSQGGRSGSGKGHGHAGHSHGDLEALMEDGDDCGHDDEYGGEQGEICDHDDGDVEIGRKRQVVGILVLQMGIMIHSLVIGLTLAIASGADFTSLVTAIVFHNLFEGLSLGIRIAGLPAPSQLPSETTTPQSRRRFSWLKPTLAVLFAVTTPVGIIIGLLAFESGGSGGNSVRLKLIEGIMSAISAGMLIYAACVEMLAGDFVLDPTLWRSGVRRQVLALASLGAGVAGMGLIG